MSKVFSWLVYILIVSPNRAYSRLSMYNTLHKFSVILSVTLLVINVDNCIILTSCLIGLIVYRAIYFQIDF